MTQIIMAVYEGGILRPLEPIDLKESQKVRLHVLPEPKPDKTTEAIHALIESGLLTPPPREGEPPLISASERRKLADAIAERIQRPLSEIVIEDRGQW